MPLDDTALLERWKTRRDAETFDEIVRRFADQVFGTCRRILRNDADAEEVAQECFLLLVRSGGEVRSSLGGWLHRAATSRSLDRIRHETRRRARESAYEQHAPKATEASWDDIQEHVDAAIDQLPESTRDMIVAHFLGRKTHEEIASEQGMNRRAVSQRIQRGLAAIRQDFARRGIALSAAALAPLLASNAAAAPLSLKASLGKLAIAAGTAGGAGGTVATTSLIGSLLIMKTKSVLLSAVICLIVAGTCVVATRRHEPVALPTPETKDVSVGVEPPNGVPALPDTAPKFAANTAPEDVALKLTAMDDLLALSRAESARALEGYPPIEDPAAYASISGTVLDRDAYPVDGAVVQVIPGDSWGGLPGVGGMSYTASSGADGGYQIAGIARAGRYYVFASQSGYASASWGKGLASSITVESGMDANGVDLVLESGVSVSGKVLTASGEPVPDAVVHCVSLDSPGSYSGLGFFGNRTDSVGYFTLGFEAKFRGGTAVLRVASDRHGSAKFSDIVIEDTEALELRLAASSIVHGTVRFGDGNPVPGARLTFFGGNIDSEDSFQGLGTLAPCDGEGRYAVALDAGLDYSVTVGFSGSDADTRQDQVLALQPGETREHNLVIGDDLITVRGRFIGQPSGRPISEPATLWVVVKQDEDGDEAARGSGNTDRPYEVRFSGEPGTYAVQASYMGSNATGPASRPFELAPGDEVNLDLEIPEPQVLSARAVDTHGAPLAGVSIIVYLDFGSQAPNIRSNEDGRFGQSFAVPPECGAYIELSKPGYATARGPVYENQSPGTVHPETTITLWSGAGFEGDLSGTDGEPLADTALSITVTSASGQTWPLQTATDAGGHFTIVDQAPAEVVDLTIATQNGEAGNWSGEQITLEANTITSLGSIALATE